MDVIQRIDELMRERGWSDYRLASESGLSTSTIANMHRRNTVPSIATLENICDAFGITLSQFFNEDSEYVHLNTEQMEMFHQWVSLTAAQKDLICRLIQEMK
jgi:transcriptional regulator with XRE-family HTH domain